jgi:hypothetical protein
MCAARRILEPPRLSLVIELEGLRVAQHHADRDPHRLDHLRDHVWRRRQPAASQVADELEPPGAPLLRLQRVLHAFHDHLDQHAA